MKITNTEVYGIKHAMRGMRNPKNSWHLNDSKLEDGNFILGDNDKKLAQSLIIAGGEHSKFMRQIQVWMDVDMPRYFWQEFDTYKFNSKNSCSTMHKMMSEEININMFCVDDDIKNILSNENRKLYSEIGDFYCELKQGEKEVFKDFTVNGIVYEVSNTGKFFSKEKIVFDSIGRERKFERKQLKISNQGGGYYGLRLGGRKGGIYLAHRIIAELFVENKKGLNIVNHKDGKKFNCSVWNLEWCTSKENNDHAVENGLRREITPYKSYKAYITNRKVSASDYFKIIDMNKSGVSKHEMAEIFGVLPAQISHLLVYGINEKALLYEEVYIWEKLIQELNNIRDLYLESETAKEKNELIRKAKQLLPEGFLQLRTVNTNYAELRNIYHQRKNHKLKEEWVDTFCKWIESLPYAKELITLEKENK